MFTYAPYNEFDISARRERLFSGTDWLYSLKAQWKLRHQWLADIDRDFIDAAARGLPGTASRLLPHASPTAKTLALWRATYEGHKTVADILFDDGVDQQAYLDAVLCKSAAGGDIPGIESALARGADLHNNNDLPLMLAATNAQERAARELLTMGADPRRAFNAYTLGQLKRSGNPAADLIERAYLHESKGKRPVIGFQPAV